MRQLPNSIGYGLYETNMGLLCSKREDGFETFIFAIDEEADLHVTLPERPNIRHSDEGYSGDDDWFRDKVYMQSDKYIQENRDIATFELNETILSENYNHIGYEEGC